MNSFGTQLRDSHDCEFVAFETFAAVQEDAKYAFGARRPREPMLVSPSRSRSGGVRKKAQKLRRQRIDSAASGPPRLSWKPWTRNFDIFLLLSIREFHRSFASRVPGAAEEPPVAPFAFPHRVFLAFRADNWGDIAACRRSDLDDTISDQLEEER